MNTTTFEEIAESLRTTVETICNDFERADDDFLPIFAFSPTDGDNVIIGIDPEYFATPENKDLLVDRIILPTANGLGAKIVGSVMSAWVASVPRDHQGDLPRPSEDPNKREAVFITVMDSLRVTSWMAEIHRDGKNPPVISSWETLPNSALTGRFIEPIQDALRDSTGRTDPAYLELLRESAIELNSDEE